MVTLPAHSKDLNPIEGLWDQVKDHLCNRVFDTRPGLEAVLPTELQRVFQTHDPAQLTSLV